METGCRRAILFLLFSPLFGTGFAQTETPVKVDKPLKSYSHWYFGAEYGMQIESEKGKGTTCVITIPAIRIDEKQSERARG